jgi:hypothetical protein
MSDSARRAVFKAKCENSEHREKSQENVGLFSQWECQCAALRGWAEFAARLVQYNEN